MNWTGLFILAAIFAVFFLFARPVKLSIKDARAYLKNGAKLIDVRTAGEFIAGHLPIAVNLPVSEIETSVTRRVKSKDQVILLYCQSGARSSAARARLLAMGYVNAFNLGSYARAERIVRGK
jgi:rhodanese-related sulfurtransferase